MDGTEPFLHDVGLRPVAAGDKDPNLYLYRRNSCHQERLHHDLKRLEQQEERSLRRTNREIIDLHLEQKGRKEILNNSRVRRRSECLEVQRGREQQHGVLLYGSITSNERRASNERLLASRPRSHDSAIKNDAFPKSASMGKAHDGKRRRASCVVTAPTTNNATRPTVSPSNSTSASSAASERRILERPRSRSHDLTSVETSSAPATSQSAASSSVALHEKYMDARSRKEFDRLKKASDRWRDAVRAGKSGGVIERTGKPPIPTSCFAASSASSDTVKKTSDVFDRLSLETRTSAMPSDKFFQLMRSKTKLLLTDSSRKLLKSTSDI